MILFIIIVIVILILSTLYFLSQTQGNPQEFFIWCSLANEDILNKNPSEKPRMALIGATIVFTAIFAFISGTYALYKIFRNSDNSLYYALGIGFFWALVIFTLDRFIVTSIRKEGNAFKQIYTASPRIILAILLSILISKPLEVKIFEDRIYRQILENKRKKQLQDLVEADSISGSKVATESAKTAGKDLDDLKDMKSKEPTTEEYKNAKTTMDTEKTAYTKIFNDNSPKAERARLNANFVRSKCPTITIDGVSRKKCDPEQDAEISRYESERNSLMAAINTQKNAYDNAARKVNEIRRKYEEELNKKIIEQTKVKNKADSISVKTDSIKRALEDEGEKANSVSYTDNFITQVEALGDLTSEGTMRWASWLITLLFLAIETAPIFVKITAKKGIYDDALENFERDEKNKILNESIKNQINVDNDLQLHAQKKQLAQTTKINLVQQAITQYEQSSSSQITSSNDPLDELKKILEDIDNI